MAPRTAASATRTHYRNTQAMSTYQAKKAAPQALQPVLFVAPDWRWEFVPSQRWANAIARSRTYMHHLHEVGRSSRRWQIVSHSQPGKVHFITMTADRGPVCSCEATSRWNSGVCWHLGALYRRLMRDSRAARLTEVVQLHIGTSGPELFSDDEPALDEWGYVVIPEEVEPYDADLDWMEQAEEFEGQRVWAEPAKDDGLTELERLYAA